MRKIPYSLIKFCNFAFVCTLFGDEYADSEYKNIK